MSKQKGEKKDIPWLRWPWNVIIYIFLVLLLRIFAIPVILLLMGYKKKHEPEGPAEGYCLQRTRQRLTRLLWALLYFFIAACCGVFFGTTFVEERTGWGMEEYAKLVVSGIAAVVFLICGIYEAFTDIRDAVSPANSRLARSIRAQLPYPDAAPDVKELFAMVDKDIRENGQWFDHVAVGQEWVLGDVVSYIPRIRAVFGRDEIRYHQSGGRSQARRVIGIYIMDDRKRTQITDLRNPDELKALLNCLELRAPGAIFRSYKEYASFNGMSDIEWENVLREFQHKKNEREFAVWEEERVGAQANQNMILKRLDGSVTSRLSPDVIRQTISQCLEYTESTFSIMSNQPIMENQRAFTELKCEILFHQGEDDQGPEEFILLLIQTPAYPGGSSEFAMSLATNRDGAEAALCAWIQGQVPDLHGWNLIEYYSGGAYRPPKKTELPPPCLVLVAASGARQSHDTFTREDVEVAAEGILDGTYQSVDLTLTKSWLWMRVETGDKTDGRCKISVTHPGSDKLRFFTTRCTHRQAAAWLLEFFDERFRPSGPEWKDYTRQVEKASRR